MAKRFIDTGFYKSPFVRGLKGSLKGLYSFIICDCDASGIWNCDLEIAGVYVGFTFTQSEFNKAFVETGKAIDLKNGRYFFPDFIEHQYPNGLSKHNPAHNNITKELLKYSLIDSNLKGLWSTSQGTKVIVKEKVMDMEEEKVKEDVTFPPNFFYIGNKIFRMPLSVWLNENKKITLEAWCQQNEANINEVFAEIDKDVGKMLTDEKHALNFFKSTAKQIEVFKQKNKNNGTKHESPTEYAERMYKATLGYNPSQVQSED